MENRFPVFCRSAEHQVIRFVRDHIFRIIKESFPDPPAAVFGTHIDLFNLKKRRTVLHDRTCPFRFFRMPEQVSGHGCPCACQKDTVSVDISLFVLPVAVNACFFFPVLRQTDQFFQDIVRKVCFKNPDILRFRQIHCCSFLLAAGDLFHLVLHCSRKKRKIRLPSSVSSR